MTITLHYAYTLDSTNPTYLGERDFLLKVAENDPLRLYGLGQGTGSSGLSVTLDSVGRPVIGYGYDLEAHAKNAYADLLAAGATIATGTTAATLQSAINGYAAGTTTLAQLNALIHLPSEAAATTLLNNIALTAETGLDSFLSGLGINWISSVPGSQEYAVLLSMWYQSPGGSGKNGYFMNSAGQPSQMTQALIAGNRAEVWYQMRYQSSQGDNGIAKRRYAESAVFGLYNESNALTSPSSVPPLEAEQVYQMLTKYRSTIILKYEKNFGTDPNSANPNMPANQILAANTAYGLTGSNAVQTLTQEFNPAATVLDGIYGFTFSALNIFDTSAPSAAYNVRTISRTSDTSADLLIGGAGNDTLTGGTGSVNGGNVYVYMAPASGTTTETINDSQDKSNGSIYVGSTQLTTAGTVIGFTGMDSTSTVALPVYDWKGTDGTLYQYKPNDAFGGVSGTGTLTISGGALSTPGDKIVINNFNMSKAQSATGYLGIHLADTLGIMPGSSYANSFVVGSPTIPNQTASVQNVQSFTISDLQARSTAQTVTLALTGGTGNDIVVIDFSLDDAANDIEWRVAA